MPKAPLEPVDSVTFTTLVDTGWRAVHTLASVFPDAFIRNSVGTRSEL